MLAVDTNVLVRLITRDDEDQVRRVVAAIADQTLFVSTTVLLEVSWVLRRVLKLSRSEVVVVLRTICGLPMAVIEQPERMTGALNACERGLDFADAVHLFGVRDCTAFLSFDRKLVRAAAALDCVPVKEP